MNENYQVLKLTLGVLATIGLYSVLYKENKFYRFFEHIFLGLAVGWALVAIWTETLEEQWWTKITGGQYLYILLVPLGLMGYMVFSRKYNWMSRIPIGILLGFWAGQQIQVWFNRFGPQILDSMRPVIPTQFSFVPNTTGIAPDELARIGREVYLSQAISNFVFVATIICVLSYFLFSIDTKNKILATTSTAGRWLLMIGFGAIFGSTVMMRFSLLIDRMYFVWFEWLMETILRRG